MVVDSKPARDFLIDRLKSRVLALRLRTDGQNLISIPNATIPVHALPPLIPGSDHVATYASQWFKPSPSRALASIAANDNTVVLIINHLCCDGGYMKYIVNHIFDDKMKGPSSPLPIAGEQVFAQQLSTVKLVQKAFNVDASLTRVFPNRTIPYPLDAPAHYASFELDPTTLPCYDKQKKKLHGFTDHIWTSDILAASAFNKKLLKIGICTSMDLRNYFDRPATWTDCLDFAYTVVTTTQAHGGQTIGDLAKSLRRSFTEQIQQKTYLGFYHGVLKALTNPDPGPPLSGVGLEVANIGVFNIKKPFVDVQPFECASNAVKGLLSLRSSQVVSESGSSPVYQTLRYASCDMSEREALIFSKMIAFAMQSFGPKVEIKQAMDELIRFHESLE